MVHFFLMLACIVSVEIFIQFKFLALLNSMLEVTRKVIYLIPQEKVSDHWKEKVVPAYAFMIMKCALQILLILLLLLSFFIALEFFTNNLLSFTLSFFGIIESIGFAFGYIYIRKLFIK